MEKHGKTRKNSYISYSFAQGNNQPTIVVVVPQKKPFEDKTIQVGQITNMTFESSAS